MKTCVKREDRVLTSSMDDHNFPRRESYQYKRVWNRHTTPQSIVSQAIICPETHTLHPGNKVSLFQGFMSSNLGKILTNTVFSDASETSKNLPCLALRQSSCSTRMRLLWSRVCCRPGMHNIWSLSPLSQLRYWKCPQWPWHTSSYSPRGFNYYGEDSPVNFLSLSIHVLRFSRLVPMLESAVDAVGGDYIWHVYWYTREKNELLSSPMVSCDVQMVEIQHAFL